MSLSIYISIYIGCYYAVHLHEGLKTHKQMDEVVKKRMANTNRENALIKNQNGSIKTTIDLLREMNNNELSRLNNSFRSVKLTLAQGINSGIKSMSEALARSAVFGESLVESFKAIAQNFLVNVIQRLIEIVARKGVELAIEKLITKEKQKQAALSMVSGGGGFLGAIGRIFGAKASGGAVAKGKPFLVGERGPELFVPNSTGQIQQAAMTSSGGGEVNVNFNISTVDASGFDQLLIQRRGTISQIINAALNERGTRDLI